MIAENMNILKNSAFKSLLYIAVFAGLLKLSAMTFTWFWNNVFNNYVELPIINQLESVGVIAFLYLILTGIKFGFGAINEKNVLNSEPICEGCQKVRNSIAIEKARTLSKEDKEQLKSAIAKCCGINAEQSKIKQLSFNEPIKEFVEKF